MGMVLLTIAVLAVMVGVLVLIGHFYQGSSADLVDWKPTRSPEVEAQNEIDDVRQMLEAQNEMRRRRGAPDLDEDALRAEVEEEEREKLRRGDPFGA
jgi:cytochrome P450